MEETAAEVCLARRSVSIKWLHISGTHTKLRPHLLVHKKKCLEKGKFSEWKSISSIFFSTKCIVPIITEMRFLKVHTNINKLCIEISMVSHSNLRSYSKKSIAVSLLAVNVILNFSKREKQLRVFKSIESLFKIYLIAGLIQHIIFFHFKHLFSTSHLYWSSVFQSQF